jgi:pantoate--beta-alanine ligase
VRTQDNSDSSLRRPPELIQDIETLRLRVTELRREGRSLGLVPTMGALHEGHLSLVRASRARCDFTAVTIFVNPTQFAPHEDLARYPRTLPGDLAVLEEVQADLVFAPASDAIYPPGFSTYVEPPEIARPWEGVCRPSHFRGVATVVLKLFQLLPADVAFFGQKDYQQALVIQHMTLDLNVPMQIEVCPIVREADGLAMSSRNRYLTAAERQQALAISRGLRLADQQVRDGIRDTEAIRERMRVELTEAGIERIDYIAVVEPNTLIETPETRPPVMALIAAYVGHTRLIDNCLLGG